MEVDDFHRETMDAPLFFFLGYPRVSLFFLSVKLPMKIHYLQDARCFRHGDEADNHVF